METDQSKIFNPILSKIGFENDALQIVITTDQDSFRIRFAEPILWQVVEEQYCGYDENETWTKNGFIQEIQNSRFLEFARNNYGFKGLRGKASHFRLITEFSVVDVISDTKPTIDQI